jgi:sulfoxide reductase heme-binding subunit YedZ
VARAQAGPPARRRVVHGIVVACGLLPFVALVAGALLSRLGANPVEAITHVTGEWALRFLVATLVVTPLRRLSRWRFLAPYRRTLGLLCFFYATLHFATYLILDLGLDPGILVEDVLERPYVTAGFTALVLLVPLAATSTRGMTRRLGRHWKTLHRLVYPAAICAVVHFLWLVKADLREPLVYASVLGVLLAVRLLWWARGRGRLPPPREVD